MTISHADARKLVKYLVDLPHENPGMAGIPNSGFRAANIPESRFIDDPLDCGTGYCVIGGEKRWAQIVQRDEFEAYAKQAQKLEK